MDKASVINTTAENELMRLLGVRIVEVTAEKVVLTMEVTPKVHQYMGIMHGGVSMYLAETAASIGAVANADLAKVTPVGVEINGNHLRAVSKGLLTVTSTHRLHRPHHGRLADGDKKQPRQIDLHLALQFSFSEETGISDPRRQLAEHTGK